MPLRIQDCILNNDLKGLQLEANANNINQFDENGSTPLYFACMKHCVEIDTIRALLSLGASVDQKDQYNETPLYIAVFNRRHAVARLLVDKGANVNQVNGSRKETALHIASRFGYEEIITWLLEKEADINAQDGDLETPLFAAARAGRHNSAYLLLASGANASLSNKDGKTPLYIASELKHKNVVIVLKASKADLKQAKAEADVELRMRPQRIPSTNDMLNRAAVDEVYRADVHRRCSAPPDVPNTTPMVVTEIKVPLHRLRTHDPLTGESYGPCRSLEEVGYDKPPPIPAELRNLPPPELPRVGGTTMVVGTGTMEGGREPIRVDNLLQDQVVEYISYPISKNA
ncbi:unnamed protein product [Phytomonas sp. EM1]|nr:unnamed protein product [Phytomonas sp. EM1]|eukprot:CCW60748.1 unnamed protein product [Phytomonas sp. isolate EM1]